MEKDGPYGLVNGARLVVLWLKMYMKGRTMKFIHLSDLHIGKRVNGFSMLEDQKYKLRQVFRKFTNKYLFVGILFLVWIAFFDKNSFVEKMQLRHKIQTLTEQKEYYQKTIEDDNRKIQELLSNRDNLEKFAREQYLMKNSNEDIYIIVDE